MIDYILFGDPVELIRRTIFIVALLISSILLHEWGHIIAFSRIKKKKIKLRFTKGDFICGDAGDYRGLTNSQYKTILGFGIGMGFIPIFIFFGVLYWFEGFLILASYIAGCRSDLRLLWDMLD